MTLIGHIVGTKGNTGRGIASIVENADYTITINLTDGTSYTTAPIAGFTDVAFDENYDLVVTKTDGTTETVETDLDDYRGVLDGIKDDAVSAKDDAESAKGDAETAQNYAEDARDKAEQWAKGTKGGTPVSSGDDGYNDNSKYYKEQAASSASSASSSASSAGTDALTSEGYAVGKQNGTDVSSGSDYYHNNAKYYSGLASDSATNAGTSESNASASASSASADALKAEGYAVGKQNGTTVISGTYYHNNAMYYNSQATNMASLATNKANSAGTDALKAEGFSVGEQNGTPVTSDSDYYENNAKYYAEQAETSAQSLVIEDALDEDSTNALENGVITKEFAKKANIDGYYESLGSGTADQLSSNIFEEDSEPYHFRTSGGSIDIGDRETDTLVGGSVAWNQLVSPNKPTFTYNGVTITNNGDGTFTFSGTANATGSGTICYTIQLQQNHKYILLCKGASNDLHFYDGYGADGYDVGNGKIVHWNRASGGAYIYFAVTSGVTYNAKVAPMLIDLTQLFGSTIADYIYTLEQGQAGAGVAFFRKYFPKPYYPYDAGTIKSVEGVSAHKTVGFNAWDEEWESGYFDTSGNPVANSSICRSKNFIHVVPNTAYFYKSNGQNHTFVYYDADKNFIRLDTAGGGNSKITTPLNCHYMKFAWVGTTYNNDICINLSWDGERNGEYEPYVEHSYPLDDSLTLRGRFEVENGKLKANGDTYISDGSVSRKWTTRNMSAFTTSDMTGLSVDDNTVRIYIGLSSMKPTVSTTEINILADKLNCYTPYYIASNDVEGISENRNANTNGFWIRIAKSKLASNDYAGMVSYFASNPINVLYELKTPTTETADPYTNPQIVDDFGTEEYVTTSIVPVGHYTQYMANLKAKLEMSPDSPNGAGDYIVRQTDGENEYVSLASNATIQDIIARLEALEGGGE